VLRMVPVLYGRADLRSQMKLRTKTKPFADMLLVSIVPSRCLTRPYRNGRIIFHFWGVC
jgi:hypothetical protein